MIRGLLVFAISLSVLSAANAADTNWTGPAGTPADWLTPANWDSGLPTNTGNAIVGNGGNAVISGPAEVSSLKVGTVARQSGTVTLTENGQLTNKNATIGGGESGTFIQTGGTLSYPASSTNFVSSMTVDTQGTYKLSGGYFGYFDPKRIGTVQPNGFSLTVKNAGRFEQTGGTATIFRTNFLDGTYILGGSGYLEGVNFWITEGSFIQTGGTSHIWGGYIGYGNINYPDSHGTFEVSGGQVDWNVMTIGNYYAGLLKITNAAAQISVRALTLDTQGSLVCPQGTAISLHSSLKNLSTNDANYAGLVNLSLICDDGLSAATLVEVAGRKLPDGVISDLNFTLGTLQVGSDLSVGYVGLQDLTDNQPSFAGSECLYVKNLVITSGSRLDLNGLNLYYETASIAPDAAINLSGGSLVQVPEPASMTLLLAGMTGWLIRKGRGK